MKLTLTNGRRVHLSELVQRRTHAGRLAGRPDRRSNEADLERMAMDARNLVPDGATPVLLTDLLAPDALDHALPDVTSCGVFQSGELDRKPSEPYSSAVVVWFQDDFGLPDQRTIDRIAQIDWERVAIDWIW